MAVVPTLAFFYIGILHSSGRSLPFAAELLASGCTVVLALCGYRIMCKYPKNILRIREQIQKSASGVLPEKFVLEQSVNSDDLAVIENNFNAMIDEMNHRLEALRARLEPESRLREDMKHRDEEILHLRKYPLLIQRLFPAWRRLIDLSLSLRTHVFGLGRYVGSIEEMKKLKSILNEVEEISEELQRMKEIGDIHEESTLICDYYDEADRVAS